MLTVATLCVIPLMLAVSAVCALVIFAAGYFLCGLVWAAAIAGLRTLTAMAGRPT